MTIFRAHKAGNTVRQAARPIHFRRRERVKSLFIAVLFFPALLSVPVLEAQKQAVDKKGIIAQIDLAESLVSQVRLGQAIEHLQAAYLLAEADRDYIALGVLSYLIGNIYEKAGRFQQALVQFEQGLKILATHQGSATALGQALEELSSSEKAYTPAAGPPVGTDLYRGEIPNLSQRLGPSPQGLESELATALAINAGNMYLNQDQYPQADALYQRALEIAHKSKAQVTGAQIQANLAWSAIKQRRFDDADARLKAALSAIDADSDLLAARRSLLALGVHLRETGHTLKAIAELKRAAALYELAGDRAGRCRALAHLGSAYFQHDDLEQAKAHYLQALELNRRIADNTTAWHANGGLAKTYHRLGDLNTALRHYEKYMAAVDRHSRRYFTDQGKVAILENHAAITDEYVNAALDLARRNGDFVHARKAIEGSRTRALKQLLEGRRSRRGKIPGRLAAGPFLYGDRWPVYRYEYADHIADSRPLEMSASPQTQMSAGVDVGIAGRPLRFEEDRTAPRRWPPVTPPPVTFLQTYVLADRTVVLVHPSGSQRMTAGVILDIKSAALAGLVDRYRSAMNVDQARGVALAAGGLTMSTQNAAVAPDEAQLSRQLYQLLIEPVRALLPADPREPVVIIPHRSLWLLSFAALRDENGEYFGDRHVLTYAASVPTWQMVASRARGSDHRNPTAWIVGNPQMPARVTNCNMTLAMDPLPGAEKEAVEIADLFQFHQAELFTGIQADRMRLDAWHPNFSVLHLATHGFGCAVDPLSSFIVLKALADSDLKLDPESETVSLNIDHRYPITLSGIKKMLHSRVMPAVKSISYPGRLDARTVINLFDLDADLVTLSACQTGLGQLTGEGLIGFTRAFLTAGARSLLVSLWRVDDRSTRDLMVNFYRQYLDHGNKGLALKLAMAKTRQRYPEPRYWAGFTMIGMAE